jgi:hypothetical protein
MLQRDWWCIELSSATINKPKWSSTSDLNLIEYLLGLTRRDQIRVADSGINHNKNSKLFIGR